MSGHEELPGSDVVPGGHCVGAVAPSSEKYPAGVSGQEVAAIALLYRPAGQSVAVLAPAVGTKLPGGAGVQLVAVPPAEKYPAVHGTQVPLTSLFPGGQLVTCASALKTLTGKITAQQRRKARQVTTHPHGGTK